MTEVEELGAELADFRRRVAGLRSARSLPRHEQLPALDAALIELQHAADVLWPRYERLAAAQHNGGRRGEAHEQQLLRALFQRLPVPTMLLDRDTVVRRLNVAATQLFGVRAGYATGRSLATSLAREGRAAFRSQVAAVARGEGERSLVVHLLRPSELSHEDGGALRATLSALRPPQEPRAAVLAVFQRIMGEMAVPPTPGGPSVRRPNPRPDLGEVTRQSLLLDLVDDMATALLQVPYRSRGHSAEGGAAGPGTTGTAGTAVESGPRPGRQTATGTDAGGPGTAEADGGFRAGTHAVTEAVTRTLGERFTDWVIVDVAAGGRLRRARVSGPDQQVRKALAAQDPADCPLVVGAVRRGTEALQVRPEDPDALGRDATGAQVLVRAEVSSLLCVPLVAPGHGAAEGRTLGALTLLRTGPRRAFELVEAGAVDRMARHIAIALRGLL